MFPYPNMDTKRGRWMALGHLLLTCLVMMALGFGSGEDAGAASPTPVGPYVVVDLSANWVWLYDEYGDLVIDGGTVDNAEELHPGTYKVPYMTEDGKMGKLEVNYSTNGHWRLNYFTRIVGGMGFHEIPINSSTGVRMHDESWLGQNWDTSGGCVRVSNEVAQAIFQYIWPGNTVIVVE